LQGVEREKRIEAGDAADVLYLTTYLAPGLQLRSYEAQPHCASLGLN
jgi:hypothetical protein